MGDLGTAEGVILAAIAVHTVAFGVMYVIHERHTKEALSSSSPQISSKVGTVARDTELSER